MNWTRLLRGGSLAVAGLALLVGAVLGDPQAIVTALLGLGIGLGILRLGFRGEDRQFLTTLFIVAWGARVVGAVVSHEVLMSMGRGGFVLLDDRAYDKTGWALTRYWVGSLKGIAESDFYLLVNYSYLLGAVYWLLGHSLLAAKMLNVAFGALLAVATYALSAEILDRRIARVAAVITAFFPSLMAWSVLNLKDILVVLLTVSAIFGAVRYARRHEWWALGLCLAALLSLENLRMFVFFILMWLIPVTFLLTDRSERTVDWRTLVLAVVLGIVVVIPPGYYMYTQDLRDFAPLLLPLFFGPAALLMARDSGGRRKLLLLAPIVASILAFGYVTNNEKLGTNFLTPKALTNAEWKRWLEENKAETGNNEFEGVKPKKDDGDIHVRSLAALPRAVVTVLTGPTPLDAMRSNSARAVMPEMLALYLLLATAVAGLAVTVRRSWRDFALPLGFAAAWVVALALTEGNTGNIFRHRSQYLPFMFMLSGVGFVWLWDRWQARRVGFAHQWPRDRFSQEAAVPHPTMVGEAHPTGS